MNTNEKNRKYTIEEIRQLEAQCSKMRSEAIFNAFASLFTSLWSRASSPAPAGIDRSAPSVDHSLGASAR